MNMILIVLYRNSTQRDWSVQIDGIRFDHVSTETLDDLVEYSSLAAQQQLLEPRIPLRTATSSGYITN
jgi:hypothetical protein